VQEVEREDEQKVGDDLRADFETRLRSQGAEEEESGQDRGSRGKEPSRAIEGEKDQKHERGIEYHQAGSVEASLHKRQDHLVAPAGVDVAVIAQGIGERIVLRPSGAGEQALARRQVVPDVGVADAAGG